MWVSTFFCANELVETKWNESKINLFQSLNFSQWSTGFGKSKKHLSFSMIIPNLYVSVSEVFLCHSHNSLTTFTQFFCLFVVLFIQCVIMYVCMWSREECKHYNINKILFGWISKSVSICAKHYVQYIHYILSNSSFRSNSNCLFVCICV